MADDVVAKAADAAYWQQRRAALIAASDDGSKWDRLFESLVDDWCKAFTASLLSIGRGRYLGTPSEFWDAARGAAAGAFENVGADHTPREAAEEEWREWLLASA